MSVNSEVMAEPADDAAGLLARRTSYAQLVQTLDLLLGWKLAVILGSKLQRRIKLRSPVGVSQNVAHQLV